MNLPHSLFLDTLWSSQAFDNHNTQLSNLPESLSLGCQIPYVTRNVAT